jgi:hypothetical protein
MHSFVSSETTNVFSWKGLKVKDLILNIVAIQVQYISQKYS